MRQKFHKLYVEIESVAIAKLIKTSYEQCPIGTLSYLIIPGAMNETNDLAYLGYIYVIKWSSHGYRQMLYVI